jgi:hypothetical protein
MSITRKLTVAGISVAVVALGLQLVPASAGSDRRAPDYCRGSGSLSAASLPAVVPADECDLTGRLITAGGGAVRVPPPGEGVSADAVGSNWETGLLVATMPNGNVRIEVDRGPGGIHVLGTNTGDPCVDLSIAGCLDPCVDTSHAVNDVNAKVKKSQPWWFNSSSRPDEFPTASVPRDAIKVGSQNLVSTNNDCGLSDIVPKPAPYQGTTTRTADMNQPGGVTGCKSSSNTDDKNTVDFGTLNFGQAVGLACTFFVRPPGSNRWFIKESDIRLRIDGGAANPTDTEWTTAVDPNTCSNLMDVESVMTHERGHAFGLKHANANQSHFLQTMYPSVPPCYTYGRTLGKGDRKGLAELY